MKNSVEEWKGAMWALENQAKALHDLISRVDAQMSKDVNTAAYKALRQALLKSIELETLLSEARGWQSDE
jgi:hypothetical protein